mgnify:CR=1 FL=1
MIGERLKHAFVGNEAWVLSYREECFDQIGLKASQKVPLFNGPLECEFRKYEIFDGKYKEFKSQEEGEEKKEAEGEQAPRFRERKEFKPRREGEFKPRRMVNPDSREENTSRAEKVVSSKVVTEIESRGESSAEEEIREARESLKEIGSRGFRRRKRNKPF